MERIRSGYYTDAYFNFTQELLEAKGRHPRVTMQVFQGKEQSILGGIDEAIAILKLAAGRTRAGRRVDRRLGPARPSMPSTKAIRSSRGRR